MERYTVVHRLGPTTLGDLLLVRDRASHELYTMKVAKLNDLAVNERRMVQNEATVLASLHHPNIVQCVRQFHSKSKGWLCFIMEPLEGGDLATVVQSCRSEDRQLSQGLVLDWFLQIVLAVDHCHAQRVLHRNLALRNVFLAADGVLKLGDFAVCGRNLDQAMTFVGTPSYLSPELVNGRPYNQKSDVWALGVLLYTLMARDHPFKADTFDDLAACILSGLYRPLPSSYSTGMHALVAMQLQLQPAARPSTQELLGSPMLSTRLQLWRTGAPNITVPCTYVQRLPLREILVVDSLVGQSNNSTADATEVASPPLPHLGSLRRSVVAHRVSAARNSGSFLGESENETDDGCLDVRCPSSQCPSLGESSTGPSSPRHVHWGVPIATVFVFQSAVEPLDAEAVTGDNCQAPLDNPTYVPLGSIPTAVSPELEISGIVTTEVVGPLASNDQGLPPLGGRGRVPTHLEASPRPTRPSSTCLPPPLRAKGRRRQLFERADLHQPGMQGASTCTADHLPAAESPPHPSAAYYLLVDAAA